MSGADSVTGTTETDLIKEPSDDDTLSGGAGADTLYQSAHSSSSRLIIAP